VGAGLTEVEPAADLPEISWDRSTTSFVVASFCALAGAFTLTTAVGKQVYDISGRELDLGFVGLAEFLPALLLLFVTGTIADRRSRKRVASVAMVGQAATCAAMALYVASDPTAVGPIFAIAFAFGVARAFASPSTRALIADVAGPTGLPWLVPRRSAATQAPFIVGPVLGGTLYAVDPALPHVAAAVLLLAGSLLLSTVRVRVRQVLAPSPTGSRVQDTLEGLRFVRRTRLLLGALTLDLFAVLFGGAVALLPAIADDKLGVGAVGYGWLRAAIGIGGGITTLVLARRPLQRHVGRSLLVAVAVFGAMTIVVGSTSVYAVAFVALVTLSAADAVSVYVRSTIVPLVTPSSKRGRVSAVEMLLIGATNELGSFESGVTGQLLGAGPAVVVGGAATLVVAGTYWVTFPDLRDLDAFPAPATD
jgi:MFS family permease